MENLRIIILRGRETDPAIFKYCRALSKQNYQVKLLIWNRRGSLINPNIESEKFSMEQFSFHAPLDKFSAILFYPFWWIYIIYFLLKEKSDFVHACDFDTLVPVLLLRKFRKFKFVYTIFDFYANNVQDGTFSSLRMILKRLVKMIEFGGINKSDLLILVDESRVEEIKGTMAKNLIFINNTPEDLTMPASPEKQNANARVSIFFCGLLMNFRGIKDMIKAISAIPEVQLTLAGQLVDADILDGTADHSEQISYIGWITSYQEVLERSMSADILFRFSDPKHPKTRYESPNKLFEAMMLGKPIIVSANSRMADIVAEENCGLIVPYGDVQAIRKSLKILKEDPDKYQQLSKNGRNAYLQKYNWKIMERRLIDAYNKISE
jgi:glycosyltransferase involved in cell wall biosynthesis